MLLLPSFPRLSEQLLRSPPCSAAKGILKLFACKHLIAESLTGQRSRREPAWPQRRHAKLRHAQWSRRGGNVVSVASYQSSDVRPIGCHRPWARACLKKACCTEAAGKRLNEAPTRRKRGFRDPLLRKGRWPWFVLFPASFLSCLRKDVDSRCRDPANLHELLALLRVHEAPQTG